MSAYSFSLRIQVESICTGRYDHPSEYHRNEKEEIICYILKSGQWDT